jgi:hypothetical protein
MWLIAIASILPVTVRSAGAPAPSATQAQPQQLDEILVEGRKPLRDAQKIFDWMARLVGQFIVEGSVHLHADGAPSEPLQAHGRADCVGFGPAPGVLCELKIRWPEAKGPNGESLFGGASTLDPASMLFGFAPDRIGIHHMLADNSGIANEALGYLLSGDLLASRTKCVNVPRRCERVVQITAAPDRSSVEIKIELEVDYQKAASFTFLMRRVPGSPAVVFPGGDPCLRCDLTGGGK